MTEPRYTVVAGAVVAEDIAALTAHAADVVGAAAAIVDGPAHGRVTGKEFGRRHVSGDLTGLARGKFEVPGRRPQRFRLVYRQRDETTREIIAIGLRDEHAIYQAAVRPARVLSESGTSPMMAGRLTTGRNRA